MIRKSLGLVLVGATLSFVPVVAAPHAALATPCDHRTYDNVYKKSVYVEARINGEDSVYNRSSSMAQYQVTYGREESKSVTKSWEAGASAGFSFAGVGADVEAKYGESYTDGASTSASKSITQNIKPRHTAWIRAVFYRRVLRWTAWTWRWSDRKDACVKKTLAVAHWGDPKVQYVLIQKDGRVFPSREVVR